MTRFCCCAYILTTAQVLVSATSETEWRGVIKEESDAFLFEPSDQIRVISPSIFPKPTRKIDDNAVPIVEPNYGVHRKEKDAVLAYAEGYSIHYYLMFLETLTETGFSGDVVLAIADPKIIKPDVLDYLITYTLPSIEADDGKIHVVVYQLPLVCESKNGPTGRSLVKSGDTDVFQMCQLSNVYGWKDPVTGKVTGTAPDPREGRVVATIRYELYWIWSLQYNAESWLMLIDARDSFFQTNPFIDLPRQKPGTAVDGLLYLYGENAEATRLGKSKKNIKWLQIGYGDAVLDALSDKPTICSGSTMGEQIAIESYLRAMVNEHDECNIRMTGSDQGFHNYLYYSSKLSHVDTIRRIVVWEQGRGAINNLGALRTKPFSEWGLYNNKTHEIYQWNGRTLSPVAHQWDRDKNLHSYIQSVKFQRLEREWRAKKAQQKAVV